MEPCRKRGKDLDCATHLSINPRMSSEMFEGKNGIRSTASIVHRPCPYCKEPKPLFARELKTYTRMFWRLLVAASVCGLYVAADPQIFDPPNQGINSIVTWTAVFTGGLFAVFAILHGVRYLMKKSQG